MKFMFKIKFFQSKLWLALPLILFSFQTFLAGIFGYILTKILAGKKPGERGKIKSVVIELEKWKIHLHHWLIACGILLANFYFQFLPAANFSLGFLGGVMIQGLTYPDWHKIIIRKSL